MGKQVGGETGKGKEKGELREGGEREGPGIEEEVVGKFSEMRFGA